MSNGIPHPLTDKILADLVRDAVATTLVANGNSTNLKSLKHSNQVALGSDLPSHLRKIKRWLVTKEVAVIMHWHTESVYRRIRNDGFPAHRDKHRWKFDPSKVADWIEQQAGNVVLATTDTKNT